MNSLAGYYVVWDTPKSEPHDNGHGHFTVYRGHEAAKRKARALNRAVFPPMTRYHPRPAAKALAATGGLQ